MPTVLISTLCEDGNTNLGPYSLVQPYYVAGALKATYKLLYAAGICDFEPLNAMFFPVQSIGFLLAGAGIIAMFCFKKSKGIKLLSVAPVVWSGTFLFVGLMVAGLGCMNVGLSILAVKMKNIM